MTYLTAQEEKELLKSKSIDAAAKALAIAAHANKVNVTDLVTLVLSKATTEFKIMRYE